MHAATQVSHVQFSPNGRWLLGRSINTVFVWDMNTVHRLKLSMDISYGVTQRTGDKARVIAATFSADSKTVICVKENGKCLQWPIRLVERLRVCALLKPSVPSNAYLAHIDVVDDHPPFGGLLRGAQGAQL